MLTILVGLVERSEVRFQQHMPRLTRERSNSLISSSIESHKSAIHRQLSNYSIFQRGYSDECFSHLHKAMSKKLL